MRAETAPEYPQPSCYRARYYDPTTGRFLAEDPILFGGGINFYDYVANGPVLFVDPFGLQTPDSQEKNNDKKYAGYYNSFWGYRFAKEALSASQEWVRQRNLGDQALHNGAGDAFRHCFWSCTMAKYIGEKAAEIIGDEHEKAGNRTGQPHNEELMDRANNLVGRTCALNDPKAKNCWDSCTDRYYKGQLFGLGARPLLPVH